MFTHLSRIWARGGALVAGICAAAPAFGQIAAPPAPPSLFRQVAPHPTGKNGYELLLLAADAFRASRYYDKAQEAGTTLAFKQQLLADRQAAQALKLLREGLQMPVTSPREVLTFSTPRPELAAFRSLARLLALQQYVFLAEGRVPDALATARLGLRFSQAIQTDTLISGLVGLAVSAISLQPLVDHLDQLSARDCGTLYQICLECLAQPDPELRVLIADQHWTRKATVELRQQVAEQGVLAAAKGLGLDEASVRSALKVFPTSPAAIDTLSREVEQRMEDQFQRVLHELERPPWERVAVETYADDLAGRIAGFLTPPSYAREVDERYTREAARIHLIASHCAIRRYRWEYDRLPPSLAVLNLGALATDPFTGQMFHYAVHGSRYSLTSAGPPAAEDDPRAVNGRLPISLTPDE